MKDIIEKYKKGELTLYEFLHNGYLFVAGDKWTLDGGDRVVVKERALGVVNKPQSTDIHCYVHKSFALDKEIAAMEKQPEYEYVQCEYDRFSNAARDFEDNALWYKVNEDYFQVELIQDCLDFFDQNNLYRRVEITPEVKREREVEELAQAISYAEDAARGYKRLLLAEMSEEERRVMTEMAQAALEWMESKK